MGFQNDGESEQDQPREYLGLSTTIALQRLHDDIETVLTAYEERYAKQRLVLGFDTHEG